MVTFEQGPGIRDLDPAAAHNLRRADPTGRFLCSNPSNRPRSNRERPALAAGRSTVAVGVDKRLATIDGAPRCTGDTRPSGGSRVGRAGACHTGGSPGTPGPRSTTAVGAAAAAAAAASAAPSTVGTAPVSCLGVGQGVGLGLWADLQVAWIPRGFGMGLGIGCAIGTLLGVGVGLRIGEALAS